MKVTGKRNLKNNAIISEFMDIPTMMEVDFREKYRGYSIGQMIKLRRPRFTETLDYHSSWDSLIPVYHKCQDTLGETTDIFRELFHGIILFSNIKFLYEAIMEAIEWITSKNK